MQAGLPLGPVRWFARGEVYQPEVAGQVDTENQALISLLHSWREEDATQDTQQLERWEAETEELMENLQSSRLVLRGQE